MLDFGMIPALPAFAGHVPDAFKTVHPSANVTKSSRWAGFPDQFCCVSFLEPTDPLYVDVGAKFIELFIKNFNPTSHIYNADQFNEMRPGSDNPDYLKKAA